MDIKKISEVISIIKKGKYKAFLVGGSTRDLLLSRDFNDVDIATNAPLSFIEKTFKVENDDGKSMGSIKISYKNLVIEITKFRLEKYNEKSTFPKIDKFIGDPKERIIQDPSRILRGIRLAYKLNFSIDEQTDLAFKENVNELSRLSKGRFNKEIEKMEVELGENKTKAILQLYNINKGE